MSGREIYRERQIIIMEPKEERKPVQPAVGVPVNDAGRNLTGPGPAVCMGPDIKHPIDKALAQVLRTFGFDVSDAPQSAEVMICSSASECLKQLGAGKAVIHVAFGKSEEPAQGIMANAAFSKRYHYIAAQEGALVPGLLQVLANLKTAPAKTGLPEIPPGAESRPPSPDLKLPELSACPVHGKKVWVVDDSQRNLGSAMAQFGPHNDTTIFQSYVDFFEALSKQSPDIVLLDMLMPAEGHMLGSNAREQCVGAVFPAGLFAALAAARHGVPYIVIQTDAGHHDHPALAACDFIGWHTLIDVGNSKLVIVQARTTDGVKDWGAGLQSLIDRSEVFKPLAKPKA
jgi:CheY-like chemotaxis protein